MGRFIKLTLVVLLAIGLGVNVTPGHTLPFAGTGQVAFSAASSSGDCHACGDCAQPCVTMAACGAACVSSSVMPHLQRVVSRGHSHRFVPQPDWQLSSAELRTPTPPPRLSHSI